MRFFVIMQTMEIINKNEIEILDNKKSPIIDFKKDPSEIDKFRKPNALIKGIYGGGIKDKDNQDVSYNAHDYKVINFLLLILQESMEELKATNPKATPTIYTRISFELDFYKELVDDSPNWKQKLFRSLLKFNKTFIELQNYTDNFGKKYERKNIQIIYDPGFYDEKKQNKNQKCEVTFNEMIVYPVFEKRAYTHFEYKKLKLLKNKYAMQLYEYLRYKLQEAVNNKIDTTDEEIVLTEKDFKFIFGKQQAMIVKDKGLWQVLNRNIHFEKYIIPHVKNLIDFEYKINYEEKNITFKFKAQNLEQFRTVFPTELDVAAEKFKTLSKTKLIHEDETTRVYELNRNFETDENANLQRFVEALTTIYKDKLILDLNETSKFGGDNFRIFSNTFFSEKTKRPLTLSKQKKLLLYLFLNKYSYIKFKAIQLGIWQDDANEQNLAKYEGRLFKDEYLDMEKIISVEQNKEGYSITYKIRNKDDYKTGFISSLEALDDMLKTKQRVEKTLFDFDDLDETDEDDDEPLNYFAEDRQFSEDGF